MLEVARVILEKCPERVGELIDVRMSLAELQMEREDLDLSAEDYLAAKGMLEEHLPRDMKRMSQVLSMLGLVMQMKGDLAKAVEYMHEGLAKCQAELDAAQAAPGDSEDHKRKIEHLEEMTEGLKERLAELEETKKAQKPKLAPAAAGSMEAKMQAILGGGGPPVNPFDKPSGTVPANPFDKPTGDVPANPFAGAGGSVEGAPRTVTNLGVIKAGTKRITPVAAAEEPAVKKAKGDENAADKPAEGAEPAAPPPAFLAAYAGTQQ